MTRGALSVSIVLTEDAPAEEITKVADAAISEHANMLSRKITPHTISLVGEGEIRQYNKQAVETKTSTIRVINELKNTINVSKQALSDEQMETLTQLEDLRRSAANEEYLTDEKSDGIDADNSKPGWSKRIAVKWFVFGEILYAFIYLAILILRNGIICSKDAENYTQTRLISAICEREGISRISIINTADREWGDIIIRLKEIAGTAGVELNEINANGDIDEQELLLVKEIVYISARGSKIKDIIRAVTLCNEYNIRPLGCIYLGYL